MTGKKASEDYKDFGKIKGESITSNHTFVPKEALRILCECANGEKKLLFSDSLDLETIIKKDLDNKEKLEKNYEKLKVEIYDVKIENEYLKAQLEFSGLLEYETKKELTKYKRAFEILKEIFDIRFEKDEDGDCWIKIFPKTYDDRHILGEPTNEQYELLEELMKSEI